MTDKINKLWKRMNDSRVKLAETTKPFYKKYFMKAEIYGHNKIDYKYDGVLGTSVYDSNKLKDLNKLVNDVINFLKLFDSNNIKIVMNKTTRMAADTANLKDEDGNFIKKEVVIPDLYIYFKDFDDFEAFVKKFYDIDKGVIDKISMPRNLNHYNELIKTAKASKGGPKHRVLTRAKLFRGKYKYSVTFEVKNETRNTKTFLGNKIVPLFLKIIGTPGFDVTKDELIPNTNSRFFYNEIARYAWRSLLRARKKPDLKKEIQTMIKYLTVRANNLNHSLANPPEFNFKIYTNDDSFLAASRNGVFDKYAKVTVHEINQV